MKLGKNYYKHDITSADTWWHVDHTHKSFKLYDLYCDLGREENKQGQIMIGKLSGTQLVNPEPNWYKLIFASYGGFLHVDCCFESPNSATLRQKFLQPENPRWPPPSQ